MPAPILIGTYSSEPDLQYDLGQVGAYAKGNEGSQYFLFASVRTNSDQALAAEAAMLEPLRPYGFEIFPPPNSLGATPPPAAIPGTISSVPAPNANPPTSTAQPYWDGPWLRNYSEGSQDCTSRGLDYWVVQPGGDTDIYALKLGCFPEDWVQALNSHCQQQPFSPGGQCAVWDQNSIMSTFGQHGDLLIVALTRDCLNRAGLTGFHEGPLHHDCVMRP
ncbi:Mycobacterium rhizamassiliense ORFan [Mycobacterium rhizamassiliense]|uniref:Mycobacterium rhizamassiliense ORFan n=1 Tax=Mycobacterium rhizamassiliense TaxID=1841860 RepID=A0A2U3NWA7_9MYCO|nr:hypothetical protein [Mycobacterium rhizamassiliense]SPM35799.1 Mycobacterium rhizamassiliense ORFan [Mycobacterium rhizamassiliense]